MDHRLQSLFQRIQQQTATSLSTDAGTPQKVLLHLGIDMVTNSAYIQLVNSKMKPLEVEADNFTGDVAMLIRAINRINDNSFDVWGDAENPGRVFLNEHPELIFLIQRCENILVDDEGKAITFAEEAERPTLYFENVEDGFMSFLRIQSADSDDPAIVAALSDTFVLAGNNVIYPVTTLGENYALLSSFAFQTVTEDIIEDYLSVLFSYLRNIRLDRSQFNLVDNGETIDAVPTLCFEKVDADKALYLRIMNAIPGIEDELTERMQLTVRAVRGMDNTIYLKHINRRPLSDSISILEKILHDNAPSRQAKKDIYQEGAFFIVPEDSAGPFLYNALPQLLKNFALLGSDKLREYKVTPAMPKLNVNLSSGIDFLEGDATVELGDEVLSVQDILNRWRKHHYITLSDGNRAIIADDYMKRLERIFDTSKKKRGKVRISFFDLPEVEDLLEQKLEGEVFQRHRDIYEGFNKLRSQKLPKPKVNATLRDYQQEGVKWIKYLYDNDLGGCLADDMGLGKTLQAITVLADIYPNTKKPSLVVMPRSLIFNWQNEIQKFAPKLKVYTYYAQERDLKQAMKHQVVLTTYAVVRNDIEQLKDKKFHYVILDESQNIKNVTAQATQAVHLLNAEHRLALSGTPVENNLTELYSLFRFLNPAMFGSLEVFNQRYTYPIQKDGDKNVLHQLRRKIYPFLLRRLKKDVLTELPDRIDQTLVVEMSDRQRKLYEERRKYYKTIIDSDIKKEGIHKAQFVMFQALNELRQIASIPENFSDGKIASPKIEQLVNSLQEAVENGHKVVVFFNFLTGIELVAERLAELGIAYVEMTGATTNRKKVVDKFQKDPDCMVMLMTLKTGGVGLNLTAADTVFIFEPWWNKAAEEQAINRLHRIGQTSKVLAYSIIAQNTIEEKILLLQQKKAELFNGLIGSDASSSKVLTEEDINFILG